VDNNLVVTLCGEYPSDFTKVNFISNPDFVFTNDPLYPPTTLLDAERNIVTVNSFIECEHYVSGGWDYLPQINIESTYHVYIGVFLIAFLVSEFIIKKIRAKTID